MRLFLDTNVVMDFMECRTPFVYDAVRIIRMGYEGVHQLFASDLRRTNCTNSYPSCGLTCMWPA